MISHFSLLNEVKEQLYSFSFDAPRYLGTLFNSHSLASAKKGGER